MQGNVEGSVLIYSFEEYKEKGGPRDMLDVYATLKGRAKSSESTYISAVDQSLSGIPVDYDVIRRLRLTAQVWWYIIHLWFHKPLRNVDYGNFNLTEFNKL